MIFYSFKVFGAKGLQPLSIAFNVFQYHFQCSILLHFWGLKCKCWRKLSANNFVISIHLQKEIRIECKEVSLVGLFFLQGCVSSWIVWRQERFFSAANTFLLLSWDKHPQFSIQFLEHDLLSRSALGVYNCQEGEFKLKSLSIRLW